MDPVSAAFFAVVVASWWVSRRGAEFRDRAFAAAGSDRHALRMQERQHEHERRMTAQKQRHELRLAGKPVAPIQEAAAHRIRQPKARADMRGARAWWFDLCADRAEELTRQRRERERRTAAGEQEWQKFGRAFRDWYRRAGERAGERWQERNAPRDPHRSWVDAERTDRPAADRPNPGAPDTTPVDADVVDEPAGPQQPQRRELEPSWPDWSAPRTDQPESMPCPDCQGKGCETCGHDGRVPAWLADPAINTGAGEWTTSPAPEVPPGAVRAVAERIPEPLGASPAESTNNSTNDGGPMSETAASRAAAEAFSKNNPRSRKQAEAAAGLATVASIEAGVASQSAKHGPTVRQHVPAGTAINQGASMAEIVSPETARADAEFISTEITALVAHLDARIGEMQARQIAGVEAYVAMRDKVAGVVPVADEAAQTFAEHIAKQDALLAGGKPGDGSYMGLD